MLLSNETYDKLKFLAIYVIPSIATFVGVCGCALRWDVHDFGRLLAHRLVRSDHAPAKPQVGSTA